MQENHSAITGFIVDAKTPKSTQFEKTIPALPESAQLAVDAATAILPKRKMRNLDFYKSLDSQGVDSLNHLKIILAAENLAEITIPDNIAANIQSLKDLAQVIGKAKNWSIS